MMRIQWNEFETDESINKVGVCVIDESYNKCLNCKNRVQFLGYHSDYMACMKDNGKSVNSIKLNVYKILESDCKDYEWKSEVEGKVCERRVK